VLHCRTDRANVWILAILCVLSVVPSVPSAWPLEQLPVAKIVSVDAPRQVWPDENFAVLVAVNYSSSYSTDIAVLDYSTGYVLASKGLIIPAGMNYFSFLITGRDSPGLWTLVASVRVWYHSGWYGNEDGGTFLFEVTVLEFTGASLNLASNLHPTLVKVDDVPYSIGSEGLQLTSTRGVHTIEVEPLIFLDDDVRAVFDHWSDGVRSASRTAYLGSKLDLSIVYVKEFLLTVQSNAGETAGSGWYPTGMNATFATLDPLAVKSPLVDQRLRYVFTHWSGDSNSTSPVAWTIMDRPKTVVANWSEDASEITIEYHLVVASLVLLSCSIVLIAVTIILRQRAVAGFPHQNPPRRVARGRLLVVLLFAALACSSVIQRVDASPSLRPDTVQIGNALWYYWNQAASDTMLIWLGGGSVEQTAFLVNPCEFESYNTIRFIQDLARYYDIVALKKGSVRSVDLSLNRTMYREPYPAAENFMEKLRLWARDRGYVYTYVVGYSVGAMVAARELVVANPMAWTSPNGLIIITTKIPEAVSDQMHDLRASLLLLYGEEISPEFTASGERIFQNAPEEGWYGNFWYHKEYHVIPDVEHEVWTIRDSGEYDGRALLMTTKFIESSKSLQFDRLEERAREVSLNITVDGEDGSAFNVRAHSLKLPLRVGTRQVFRITTELEYELTSNSTVAVVMFSLNDTSIVSAAERQLSGRGRTQFLATLLSGDNPGRLHFVSIPLVHVEDGWVLIPSAAKHAIVEVSDMPRITVLVGYPGVAVQIDEEVVETGPDGKVTMDVVQGEHVVSVPSFIALENTSHLLYQSLNETSHSGTLHITIHDDLYLVAIYRRQFLLNVTSTLGQVEGSGWYDENSTATFYTRSPLITGDEETYTFAGWSGDSVDSSPISTLVMDGPKDIRALWREAEKTQDAAGLAQIRMVFITSLVTLIVSFSLAIISARRSSRSKSIDMGHQS